MIPLKEIFSIRYRIIREKTQATNEIRVAFALFLTNEIYVTIYHPVSLDLNDQLGWL